MITEAILPVDLALWPRSRAPAAASDDSARAALLRACAEAAMAGAVRLLLPALRGSRSEEVRAALEPLVATPEGAGLRIEAFETAAATRDAAVIAALEECNGRAALLIDPAMTLLDGTGPVLTAAGQMAALPPRRRRSTLGTVQLPWEQALALPVIGRAGGKPLLRFDRRPEADDRLTVFSGRAVLNTDLSLAARRPPAWPEDYHFPYETLLHAALQPERATLIHDLGLTLAEGRAAPLLLNCEMRAEAA